MKEWDTDQKIVGKMFYDCVPATRDFSEWLIRLDEESEGYDGDFKVGEDIELMEFSGLTDKNKVEIYEGDIVRWSDGDWKGEGNPRIAEVRFDPELCFFAFNVDKESGGHKFGFSNFIYTDTEKHLEVIGNVYENPELLK